MFVTAVCVLFLLKLKWPKSRNVYEHRAAFFYGFRLYRTIQDTEKVSDEREKGVKINKYLN